MTKEELKRAIATELSHRRQRAIVQAEERRTEAYAKIPRLLVLDNMSIFIGVTLARLSASGAAQAERDEQKQLLREITTECTELLCGAGYGADWLEPRYTCPVCKDTGRVEGAVCDCVKELSQKLRRDEINARFPLSLCSFSNFRLDYYTKEKNADFGVSPYEQMRQVLERCKSYAASFTPSAPSLYLLGETGIGKTHLALSIAGEVLQKGFNVVYVSSQSLFFELQQDKKEAAAMLETLNGADLLVLDDLGTEMVNAFVLSTLYNLVDTRMGRRRPTIYTTNIIEPALLETRYTEKISSRLLGGCELYRLLGDDLRLTEK